MLIPHGGEAFALTIESRRKADPSLRSVESHPTTPSLPRSVATRNLLLREEEKIRSRFLASLSRNSVSKLRHRNQLEVERGSLLFEPVEASPLVLRLVVGNSSVQVCLAKLKHAINEACQFVGQSGDGFGSPQPGAQPPEVRPEGTVAAQQIRGRQP